MAENEQDVGALLAEANDAGLKVVTRGNLLVVRGRKAAEPLMRRLLARKPEAMAALAEARRLVDAWRAAGHKVWAIGEARVRTQPPVPPEALDAARACKPALIAYLRGTTHPESQMQSDLDEYQVAPPVPGQERPPVGPPPHASEMPATAGPQGWPGATAEAAGGPHDPWRDRDLMAELDLD